ncbi:gamma-glutamyl-gamma-aminobutyrate hydrolase family protein [Gulosibacter chungangensis]|uniref:Gamma-glutamyl-gamma-aminobutyrate hydrolase family protein n=2 Tax=Gulosibacter chungangensis TaxID=979746 RepID=A0A7J5B7N0_9MICO|nr:gamma-glutamyl-gamma-aminobutyrate hydrolase family protein [Gulosibacter chungangensis]
MTTPDQSKFSYELNRDLIRTAIASLHEHGASVALHDVATDSEPDYAEVAAADGILVLGGGDVDATLYGHFDPVPNEGGKDRRADDREIAIIQEGIEADAIMLHLCRGSQLLNVACGGSLIPDVESADLNPPNLHKGAKGSPLFLDEEVQLVEGSRVRELYGTPTLTVRNGHHQAVDRVGEGLRASAVAHDGVVEGTERIDNTWIIGVQWHPEEADASKADRDILFAEFLAQVRARKSVPAV